MTVFSLKSILQWHKHVRLFVKNPFLAIIKVVNIYAIKTHKITIQDQNLYDILDKYVKVLEEKTILAITSKIISISQKRVVKITDADREKLIEQESDYFLHANSHKYNVTLTIKNNWLIPTAGIDTSNGNGYYVLWPREPQQTANGIRSYLKKRFSVAHIGVIITDSHITPLRWGVTGVAIAHSGFSALNDYIGSPDIFGRKMSMTKVNVADSLATTATLVMGEGNEQQPLAVISEVPFITFQDSNPSPTEVQERLINIEDDIFVPLLKGIQWHENM